MMTKINKSLYRFIRYLIFCISYFIFTSCQKVIDIDLNSTAPKIVIEAEISDQPASSKVILTQTVNFSETNVFPPVSGCLVKINDNLGNSEMLIETSSGIYTSASLQGIPGRIYTLEITNKGKKHTAISTMPFPATIDTLQVQKAFFGNRKLINVQFKDSAEIENYYRIIQIRNGIPQKSFFIIDDNLQDGKKLSITLFSERDSLVPGNSVHVLLQSIDKGVFDYFRTLSRRGGGQSASPANPLSNITNDALGYFNAYSVRSETIIIP